MSKALTKTDFHFPGLKSVYHGKVRDVYNINDEKLIMVATDRISAFDVVLPEGIPYKGQMLNQIAAKFLDATADICPNWKLATPDPMVTVGVLCQGFPVEMIVRGYLCGSAWRAYKSGVREICGVRLPENMRENEKFPHPIITPTTKAEMGMHDEDISKEEILARGLATPEEYEILERYTLALFERGTQIAAERGLILVRKRTDSGRHEIRVRKAQRTDLPDGRNPYARLQPLFLLGRLSGTFRERIAPKAIIERVCTRMADGKRLPRKRRATGARNDSRNRKLYQRPLHRAVRTHHRRTVCKSRY